jgi:hypothetical protein
MVTEEDKSLSNVTQWVGILSLYKDISTATSEEPIAQGFEGRNHKGGFGIAELR